MVVRLDQKVRVGDQLGRVAHVGRKKRGGAWVPTVLVSLPGDRFRKHFEHNVKVTR